MIRSWQTTARKRSKKCSKRGGQHGHFESDRNKGRPTVQRPATDVDRKTNDVRVPLHEIRADAADDSGDQNKQRDVVALTQCFRQSLDREWRVAIHLSIAARIGFFHRSHELLLLFEFRDQAVENAIVHATMVERHRRARRIIGDEHLNGSPQTARRPVPTIENTVSAFIARLLSPVQRPIPAPLKSKSSAGSARTKRAV